MRAGEPIQIHREAKRPVRRYIVLVAESYGGAEKRFFDVFTALRMRSNEYFLIAPEVLTGRFRADHPERHAVFGGLVELEVGDWSRRRFISEYRRLLRQLPAPAHFHYPMNCLWPLHTRRRDRVTMSVVLCTEPPSLRAGLHGRWHWLSMHVAQQIDVLSPSVFGAVRQSSVFQSKASLTPGGTYLRPPPIGEHLPIKHPTAIFLTRLAAGKGIERFFAVLPEVWKFIRDAVPAGFGFELAGSGSLQAEVEVLVENCVRVGVPVAYLGEVDATQALGRSMIALSLQDVTNYPSRVVAEALTLGCEVIVRDTGDSRHFGDELPGISYCDADMSPRSLGQSILEALAAQDAGGHRTRRIRAAARERFTSPLQVDYYATILG